MFVVEFQIGIKYVAYMCYACSRKLVVGDPKDSNTFTGALISKEHLAKVKGYVDLAEKEGATILCGKEELSLPERIKNVSLVLYQVLVKNSR